MVFPMNKSLTRSIGFWLLLVLSLASAAVGGWLVTGQVGSMTSTLLDGTATGVDVYVGQSLIVVGAVLIGAGVVGLLFGLGLIAVQSVLPASAPVVVEPIDWSAEQGEATVMQGDATAVETTVVETPADETPVASEEATDQKGSSGSTATATKSNVK